jgi:amino acid permease
VRRDESICCGDGDGECAITLQNINNTHVGINGGKGSIALEDYFKVTMGGFSTATIINCWIMAFGFLTFGSNSQGVILNNYSTLDTCATFCRFLTTVSVIGGYPFLISACRSEFLELMRNGTTSERETEITFVMLLSLTLASMVISNAGFVIGLVGAVLGSAIVYIFPSLLYLTHTAKLVDTKNDTRIRVERMFCRLLIAFGVVSALLGGSVSIISNFFPWLLLSDY